MSTYYLQILNLIKLLLLYKILYVQWIVVTNFISKTISEEGAPLTLAWLEDLDIVLQDTIDDETIGLKQELLAHQGWEKYTHEYIEEKLNPLGDETFTRSHDWMET